MRRTTRSRGLRFAVVAVALCAGVLAADGLADGQAPPVGVGTATPATVPVGGSTLLTVAVTPGANPTSTGLTVSCDLSALGDSATQPLFDDGTNGDPTAGDNVFSYLAPVGAGATPGATSLPCTVSDAEGRESVTDVALTVTLNKRQDCMKGGWKDFGVFKNQGDCVSYVATGGKNQPANG